MAKTEREIKKMSVKQYTSYVKKIDDKIKELQADKKFAQDTWNDEMKEVRSTPKKKK